jgi:hypothetical protein
VSDQINAILAVHRSGSIAVAEMIMAPRTVEELNHVGLAELILTGGWYI